MASMWGGERFAVNFGLDLRRTAFLSLSILECFLFEEDVVSMSSIFSISTCFSPFGINPSFQIGFPAVIQELGLVNEWIPCDSTIGCNMCRSIRTCNSCKLMCWNGRDPKRKSC